MKSYPIRFLLAILIATGVTIPLAAQDAAKDEPAVKKDETAERLREINSEISKKRSEVLKTLRGAKPRSPEYTKALSEYYGVADSYADEIIELATSQPKNRAANSLMSSLLMSRNKDVSKKASSAMIEAVKADPTSAVAYSTLSNLMRSSDRKIVAQATELMVAMVKEKPKAARSFQVLMTLLSNPSVKPMTKSEVTELLLENFGDSEKMADYAMTLTRGRLSASNIKLLETLLNDSEIAAVKATASYALGKHYTANDKTKDKGTKLLKSIVENYPEVEVYNGRANLAKLVEGEIFEAENLQIGMNVPDIIGEDVDGVKFKLSDYKGKVVVIDFWGDW